MDDRRRMLMRLKQLDDYFNKPRTEDAFTRRLLEERDNIIEALEYQEAQSAR